RRRLRELYGREAPGARRIPRALSPGRTRRSSVEALGRAWGRNRGSRTSHARWPEPLEPRQGPIVGAFATRTGGRSRLRAHAGRPLPSYGALSKTAHGQEAKRL